MLRFDPSKIEGGSLKAAATVNVNGNGTDSACDEKESGHVTFDHILSSEDPAFGKVKVSKCRIGSGIESIFSICL